MADVEAKGVILCDDIRQEQSGKYIIIGVYSAGVLVTQMPATLRLSLYTTLKFSEAGRFDLTILAEFKDSKAMIKVAMDVKDTDLLTAVPTPPLPITFSEPGDLLVSVGLSEDTMKEAARFSVDINPDVWTLFPTLSEPPSEQSGTDAQP